MLKALWPRLPHMVAALFGLSLIFIGLQFQCDFVTAQDSRSEQEQRKEHVAIVVLLIATLLIRLAYVFHYHIDSDEPQHLHVVWAWTQGLLPYRDVFDNHMPLFHMLCAPLLVALGERADILYYVRLAMIPLYGVTLWATYRIGCALSSRRVGYWAAVFTGLFPGLFFCSVEFRTDDLWTTLWILALALLVQGRMTLRRSFVVGVVLGAALGVSMKTILLLAALSAAVVVAVYISAPAGSRLPFRSLCRYAGAAAGGVVLVPLTLALFFIAKGAWAPFLYGTVQHNVVPGLGHWRRPYAMFLFLILLLLLWRSAQTIAHSAPDSRIGLRRVIVFLSTAGYAVALFCFWPLWTREDYLPFYPPLVLLFTPVILHLSERGARQSKRAVSVIARSVLVTPVGVGVLEILLLLLGGPVWRDHTQAETTLLAEVLRLTNPDDSVVDLKGETIFRPRSSYYVLEGITRTRMKHGLLPDDIPDRLIAAHTCVAVADDDRFPASTRTFLEENYLPVGDLRVVGCFLTSQSERSERFPFLVQIPARYAVIAKHGTATGWLDGFPYDGARFLTPGPHEFRAVPETGPLAVIWAQALERGFSPFGPPAETLLHLAKHTYRSPE